MNRRDFLKAGAVGLAGTAVVITTKTIVQAEPIGHYQCNRMQRYKEYVELLKENHSIHDSLLNLATETAVENDNPPLDFPNISKIFTKLFYRAYGLAVYGDSFYELVSNPDHPNEKPILFQSLPADTMYRIETIKGKVVEFQQSKEAPDYQAIARCSVEEDDGKSTSIRFLPKQIFHLRIGDCRKEFYPYGVSLLEPIRAKQSTTIGQGAIRNFKEVFKRGMIDLREKVS